MALFKNILTAITKSPIGKVLDFTTLATAHPIQTAKAVFSSTPAQSVSQLQKQFYSQPLSKQITQIVATTATAAAVVAVGGAAVGAARAGTLASSLIPATTKGKVLAAVATPVIAGAAIQAPVKTAETIFTLPSNLANVGVNVATLAGNPSIENVKTLVTENPVIVGGAVAVAAIVGAKAVVPAIVGVRQTEAIQEQTKAIEDVSRLTVLPSAAGQPQVIEIKQLPYIPSEVAAQPKAVAPSRDKVKKKKKKKAKPKPKKKKGKKKTRRSKRKSKKKKSKNIKRRASK